jgi:hypothetical protein
MDVEIGRIEGVIVRASSDGAPLFVIHDTPLAISNSKASSRASYPIQFLVIKKIAFIQQPHLAKELPGNQHRGARRVAHFSLDMLAIYRCLHQIALTERLHCREPPVVRDAASDLHRIGRIIVQDR